MPALLRTAIVLITLGVLYAGIAVLALAEVVSTPDVTRLGLGSLAVTALALPPMLVGVFTSYWSRDASARRRLRVVVAALVVVQLVGAAGLVAITVQRSSFAAASVVLVVIAAALDPACIAIGRTARRIELRRPTPADDLAGFREAIRTGWRRGGIGAAIGLAVGILIDVALLVPLAGRGDATRAVLFLPAGAGLGASMGMLTVALGIARRIRDVLGGDSPSARRIGRAVDGKPEQLSEDEAARAARYASVAPEWLRLRTTQTVVNAVAVLSMLAAALLGVSSAEEPGPDWLFAAVAVLLLVSVVGTAVARTAQLRRFRAYAETHPA